MFALSWHAVASHVARRTVQGAPARAGVSQERRAGGALTPPHWTPFGVQDQYDLWSHFEEVGQSFAQQLSISWGVGDGGGLTPPPSDPDFIVGKNEILQKEISIGCFWCTNFWTFGFQDPPPLKENSGGGKQGTRMEGMV